MSKKFEKHRTLLVFIKIHLKNTAIKAGVFQAGVFQLANPASRALIQNRLDESSNLAHRDMHAKFQLIWAVRLVRAIGEVEIDFSSYNWRQTVYSLVFYLSLILRPRIRRTY